MNTPSDAPADTSSDTSSDTPPPYQAVLDGVGPRLKRLRAKRGLTLAALSEETGISKSTLSRLESGQRRPAWSSCCRWPLRTAYPWTIWWGHPKWVTPGSG